jgi:peptidyl-prolyl cis-trans isomerase SurA
MKKIIIFVIAAVITTTIEAKKNEDPIIMSIAGKDVPLSEFIFMAKKDNSVDFANKQSVEAYVELFKNYKLKVTDAESLGLQKSEKFERELEDYKKQLQESFLTDKSGEDSVIHLIYDRMKYIPGFSCLVFRVPQRREIFPSDTVAPYNNAMSAYQRILNGETFDHVAESYRNTGGDSISYGVVSHVYPLQMVSTIDELVFTMKQGEITPPVRAVNGFYIIRLDTVIPNPGKIKVAHILIPVPTDSATSEEVMIAADHKADSIYKRIKAGDDFAELARMYSADSGSAKRGGEMPYFGLGDMVVPFEKTAYRLKNIGDISEPVRTRYGFHIIKLLDKNKFYTYEELASPIYETMKETERNFDLFKSFDNKMKERYNYKLYDEGYNELLELANTYHPFDTAFYYRGLRLDKPVVHIDTIDFPQYSLVDFSFRRPLSSKTLSTDYLNELLTFYVREIVTEMERGRIEKEYPEYNQLVKEYYDGILLFEISNKRVWSHPADKQDELEAEWMKELYEKYPVTINKKVLKNIKKYL